VPTAELRASLAGLAHRAHAASVRSDGRAAGAAPVQEHELLYCLKALAGGLDAALEFIDYIRTRAGLLVLRDDGTYVFPHRTFQEYLAAAHLLTRDDFAEALVELVRGDFTWWREVFFLAAASLAGQPDRLALLADAVLVEAEDGAPGVALVRAAASVARAMADGPFAEAAGRVKRHARFVARMQAVLAAAMVDEAGLPAAVRADAAFALARLGDPRPEVLRVDAMPFVPVPAGSFSMGSAAEDPEAYPEEVPLHPFDLPYDYWIARYPVTVAQFRAFAASRGEAPAPDPRAADSQPAAVSWHDALAFCRWLTGRLRDEAPRALEGTALDEAERAFWTGIAEGRLEAALPSEPEWEKAARGTEGSRFPWGDAADANRANHYPAEIGTPSVVGCFPSGASPVGAEEMSGNVWEWTRSLWGEEDEVPAFGYPYDPADGREALDAPPSVRRVVRGGGFPSPARSIRAASRMGLPPDTVEANFGFRVVVVPCPLPDGIEGTGG
jgi:formylglycine-generating enzyme required for sulfatase activity